MQLQSEAGRYPRTPWLARQASMLAIDEVMIMAEELAQTKLTQTPQIANFFAESSFLVANASLGMDYLARRIAANSE